MLQLDLSVFGLLFKRAMKLFYTYLLRVEGLKSLNYLSSLALYKFAVCFINKDDINTYGQHEVSV